MLPDIIYTIDPRIGLVVCLATVAIGFRILWSLAVAEASDRLSREKEAARHGGH